MNEDYIKTIREEFVKELSKKTGWGKNEVLTAFDKAASVAGARLLDRK